MILRACLDVFTYLSASVFLAKIILKIQDLLILLNATLSL